MRLLLLSNSLIPGLSYLEYAIPHISDFFGKNTKRIAFIPFAGVTVDWDTYEKKVQTVFNKLGYEIFSLHHEADPIKALGNADAVAIGGGNTFKLVNDLHETGLMTAIRERVVNGMPYTGWSAGSNVVCPALFTTNDMPIIQPPSFNAMGLIPFQINPHYLDTNPAGHGGETREDRIKEFMILNQKTTVIGLREGTILRVEGNKMNLLGDRTARIFKFGTEAFEMNNTEDFSRFLK